MAHMVNAVEHGVAHIEVARSKVNLGAQSHFAVLKLALSHSLEKVQAFFHGTVAIGAFCGGTQVAAVFSHLFAVELAYIRQTFFNKFNGIVVHLLKVIGRKVETVVPVKTEPAYILFDSVNILNILFGGVGVVHTEVAKSVVLLSRTEVYKYRLCVADMQITVRLGRKTRVNLFAVIRAALGDILIYKSVYKIA